MARRQKLLERLAVIEAELQEALWSDLFSGDGKTTRRLISNYVFPAMNSSRRTDDQQLQYLIDVAHEVRSLSDKLGLSQTGGVIDVLDSHTVTVDTNQWLEDVVRSFDDADKASKELESRLRSFLLERRADR